MSRGSTKKKRLPDLQPAKSLVDKFGDDMRLCTGEEWPREFLQFVLKNRPEYVEQTAITACILRIIDPAEDIHQSAVDEIKARREKQLEEISGTA